MKKIVLFLIASLISTASFAKVIMVEEPGYGQIGLMMNCGVPIYTNYNLDRKIPENTQGLKFGASLFYDFSYFDSKLGLLAGWDATYIYKTDDVNFTTNEFYNHNFKLGLRAYRFLTVGPMVGFNKDFSTKNDEIDWGGFINITILPFKYCGIGGEIQFTRNCGLSVMGSFSVTIPTMRKK